MTGDGKGPAGEPAGPGGARVVAVAARLSRSAVGAGDGRGDEGADGVFPVDVGVGMPVVADAGVDAGGGEVGPGQPAVVGADQFGGGSVAGEAGGVADQRARQVVGGHWSFTSVMAARTAVVSAMVLCVV